MKLFRQKLSAAKPKAARWVYLPYDQLSLEWPLLKERPAAEMGLVLVETPDKGGRRRYHKQKLLWILAHQRRFALEALEAGHPVRYLSGRAPLAEQLRKVFPETGPLLLHEPAERELRQELKDEIGAGNLEIRRHPGWLSTREDFLAVFPDGPPYRMDRFYRHLRKKTGILMEDGSPHGGKYSHDAANRKPWNGEPEAPEPLRFEPDEVTLEAAADIEAWFPEHPGTLDPGALPVTRDQIEAQLEWVEAHCLEHFGPFEDALSLKSRGIFHTRLSPLLNLHRVWPKAWLDRILSAPMPLASQEGLVRQILGWREFVRHVHVETDGFRAPGARPHAHAPTIPLPPAYWGKPSGLLCLDDVVEGVWEEGWSHHISRLMVLGNLATLIEADPQELSDWFWVAYIDAFDWVVEPNVLAMARAAVGELMTTKPYISGAAYLDRMGDACRSCQFHPKKDCPITPLYWAYLDRHRERLEGNQRVAMPLRNLAKRDERTLAWYRESFSKVQEVLGQGKKLTPKDLPKKPK